MHKLRILVAMLMACCAFGALSAAPSMAVDAGLAAQTVPAHPWPQGDCHDNWWNYAGASQGYQRIRAWDCGDYNVNTAHQTGTGTYVDYIDPNRSWVRVYYYKYQDFGWQVYCHTTVIAHEPFNWQYNTYTIEYRARNCD